MAVDNRVDRPVNPNLPKAGQAKPPMTPKISGQQAGVNLAGMLAGSDLVTANPVSTVQGSLLGPVGGGESKNNAGAQTGFQSFALAALGGEQGKEVSVMDGAGGMNFEPRKAWKGEIGRALDKAVTALQEQVQGRAKALTEAASNAVEKNPLVKELAAKAAIAANAPAGKSSAKPGVVGSFLEKEGGSNVNGADGKVFGDFVAVAQQGAQAQGMDITKMPIEDAMVYMMMLCSNDARGDMKEMLGEMELTRKKRSAIRDATTMLKELQTKAQEELRTQYNSMSETDKKSISFDDWAKDKSVAMPTITMDFSTGTASTETSAAAGGTTVDAKDTVETIGGGTLKYGDIEGQLGSLGDKKDALADISQEQQLKMQMVMERMTKADQMASNLSKKINDTIMAIVSNFKG